MRTAAMAAIAAMIAASTMTGRAEAATPSYLFTVQAAGGSSVPGHAAPGEDERFTLTLRGVSPVTRFADRPFRSASIISPAALAANWGAWFATSAPNTVLTYAASAGEAPQSIVVTLSHPRASSDGRAMTFTATRTYRTLDPSQKGANWVRPSTPRRFSSASLVIDDAGSSVTGAITAQLQQVAEQFVFAPNDANTWGALEAAMSAVLTQAWQRGQLMGPSPATAYSVTCQPTAQMILNGYMYCQVSMFLMGGRLFVTTITQQMGSA